MAINNPYQNKIECVATRLEQAMMATRLEQAIAACQTGIERECWRDLVSAVDEAALLLRLLARNGASAICGAASPGRDADGRAICGAASPGRDADGRSLRCTLSPGHTGEHQEHGFPDGPARLTLIGHWPQL